MRISDLFGRYAVCKATYYKFVEKSLSPNTYRTSQVKFTYTSPFLALIIGTRTLPYGETHSDYEFFSEGKARIPYYTNKGYKYVLLCAKNMRENPVYVDPESVVIMERQNNVMTKDIEATEFIRSHAKERQESYK